MLLALASHDDLRGLWDKTVDDETDHAAAAIAELRHLIQSFYSTPPMSVFWELSPYARMLDPVFVAFVNEAFATTITNERKR